MAITPRVKNNNHLILKDLINDLVEKCGFHQGKLIDELGFNRTSVYKILKNNKDDYTHVTDLELKKATRVCELKYKSLCKAIVEAKGRIT
ncbi:MAG: hypothetical protein ACJA0H_002361 [Francisellaceae bacterium]|jgi:hypothetical protein